MTVALTELPSLSDALYDPDDRLLTAGLVIVVQSWPDEFVAADVESLIGRTLNSRLLCCYGPWCESDGRTRSIWPDAVRVPARLARSVISAELDACRRRSPPLPVTAARDEVFSHRNHWPDGESFASVGRRRMADQPLSAVLISHDHVFAETASLVLQDVGMTTAVLRPDEAPTHFAGSPDLVVHDLDPWTDVLAASLKGALKNFPAALHVGVAAMPETVAMPDVVSRNLGTLLPRLDLVNGLLYHVRELLSA